MTQDELKQAVAKAAFDYVESKLEDDMILGVGTGSTANFFIEELGKISDGSKARSPVLKKRPGASNHTISRSLTSTAPVRLRSMLTAPMRAMRTCS